MDNPSLGSSKSRDLTSVELLTIVDALDGASNMWGGLRPDLRARLFAAIDEPSRETWVDARSIILDGESWMTLWQSVVSVVGGKATRDEFTPSRDQIVAALDIPPDEEEDSR